MNGEMDPEYFFWTRFSGLWSTSRCTIPSDVALSIISSEITSEVVLTWRWRCRFKAREQGGNSLATRSECVMASKTPKTEHAREEASSKG
ncbi:hypothetical protein VNO77_19252 [Canavalia gladiata]|uniref:Uncharacterized protein n=1 Tax=Canavalia gladiata TaxID=3824 RepID=A0AAN9QL75_CANGL